MFRGFLKAAPFLALSVLVTGCFQAEILGTNNSSSSTSDEQTNSCSLDTLTASNAYRIDASTINLASFDPSVGSRIQPLLSDEVAADTTFTDNSRLVPEPGYDTDGRYTSTGGDLNYGYLVTVKGRPTVVCGLTGTTAARITDCSSQNGTQAIWEGSKYGQSGEGDWKLVTLYSGGSCSDGNSQNEATCTANSATWIAGTGEGSTCMGGGGNGCFEVWQDVRTQLIWSDAMTDGTGYGECSTGSYGQYVTSSGCTGAGGTWTEGWSNGGYNWYEAAGYTNATGSDQTVTLTGYEAAPGQGTACADMNGNPVVCQPATPVSVCADAGAIAGLNGISTYQNPDGTNGTFDESGAKGGMTGSTHQWRLPTNADFEVADADGIRKVLPNMDEFFWSASSYSDYVYVAWGFYGDYGYLYYGFRYDASGGSVRCVGR